MCFVSVGFSFKLKHAVFRIRGSMHAQLVQAGFAGMTGRRSMSRAPSGLRQRVCSGLDLEHVCSLHAWQEVKEGEEKFEEVPARVWFLVSNEGCWTCFATAAAAFSGCERTQGLAVHGSQANGFGAHVGCFVCFSFCLQEPAEPPRQKATILMISIA